MSSLGDRARHRGRRRASARRSSTAVADARRHRRSCSTGGRPADGVDHELGRPGRHRGRRGGRAPTSPSATGGVDAVVTCAGIDVPGALDRRAQRDWERIVRREPARHRRRRARRAAGLLERRTGRVVTVASTLGHRAVGDATAYCASKFGVVGFTRALMAELQGTGRRHAAHARAAWTPPSSTSATSAVPARLPRRPSGRPGGRRRRRRVRAVASRPAARSRSWWSPDRGDLLALRRRRPARVLRCGR